MRHQILNVKSLMFVFVIVSLLYSVQGIGYGQTLTALTPEVLTEANSNNFVVTLLLEGAAWANISRIRNAVSVSGIAGVTIKQESYRVSREVWVCTSGCGSIVEFGYWETVYDGYRRPAVRRKSGTVLEVPLTINSNNFDFEPGATLTFTVRPAAIANYNGASLTATIPVTIAVSASATLPLAEQNLGVSVVTLTLTGGEYAAQLLDGAVTVSGIAGVGVSDVVRMSDTVLEVSLTIDGNNFDFDIDATLAFTVEAAAIPNYNGASLTAAIPVTAMKESVAASVMSPLTEATLNEAPVTLTLTGVVYEQALSKIRNAVTVSGIAGVTVNTSKVQRLSDTEITVALAFDGISSSTGPLTFSVGAGAIADYTGPVLTAEIPVTNTRDQNLFIYWTDWGTDKIQRANLDGSNVQDLITGLRAPSGIALDVAGGKMYWTDTGTDKIQRANLDGSNVQDLVTTGLKYPDGIALDVAGGKMYWTDSGTDKIQRANLDGSNVQDLITGLRGPSGIALDVVGGKMYWTDRYEYTPRIQRANLDGSNVEDLVTRTQGLRGPSGIALDVVGGKMYWTDRYEYASRIQRANLDGSNVEDLVTRTQGFSWPSGIALDVAGGKMYWTDWATDKIQRANLDGSNVEDLVTQGLIGPDGIAIGIFSPVNPAIIKEDVNRDGVVDVQDLVNVAQEYGKTGTNAADINGDEVVNVDDFILVAAAVDTAAAAAPAARAQVHSHFTAAQLQGWLTEARASGNTSRTYQKGIAVLEQFLALVAPEATALLANYPNPFNPETWIPYRLANDTDVSLFIYDMDGTLVRQLDLGHQRAGYYTDRSRAAYWDGRNAWGERVASGVYFYQLRAGDYLKLRKMVILK